MRTRDRGKGCEVLCRSRAVLVLVVLSVAATACSGSDNTEALEQRIGELEAQLSTTTTSEPAVEATVPSTATTTTAETTTTMVPTTTTTVVYSTADDLSDQFTTTLGALDVCVPVVSDALKSFTPFQRDGESEAAVHNCHVGPSLFLLNPMRFETAELENLHGATEEIAELFHSYRDAAERVFERGEPVYVEALNTVAAKLNEAIANLDTERDGFDTSGWSPIEAAKVPQPKPFTVHMFYARGHEAEVIEDWSSPVGFLQPPLAFTDWRWCSDGFNLGFRAVTNGGDEVDVERCSAELAATADPTKTVRGNGWYYVGDEIAPGTWRSRGEGDGCYWATYRADGSIIDNHFGPSTTTMRVPAKAYQVEMDGCGVWLFG